MTVAKNQRRLGAKNPMKDINTITTIPNVPLGGAGVGNGSFTASEVYAVGWIGFTTYLPLAKREPIR